MNQKNNRVYPILLIVLALGMVLNFAKEYRGINFEIGYTSGAAFVIYLVVLGYIGSKINFKFFPKENRLLLFAMFFFVYSICHSYQMVSEIYPDKTIIKLLKESMRSLDARLKGQTNEAQIWRGDFQRFNPLVELANKNISHAFDIFREWEKELNQYDFDNILIEQTFNDPQRINEIRTNMVVSVAKIATLSNKYNHVFDNFLPELNSKLDELFSKTKNENPNKKDEDFYRGVKVGFLEGHQSYKAFGKTLFETEAAILKKYIEILSFIEARQGRFNFDDERLFFVEDKDLALYKEHIVDLKISVKLKSDLEAEWRVKAQALLQKGEALINAR